MAKKYSSDLPIEVIERKLKKMIEVHASNTFKTHLAQIFLSRNNDRVCGTVQGNYAEMWLCEQGRGVGLPFYPIVSVNVETANNRTKVFISSKMNAFGSIITILIFGIIFCSALNTPLVREATSFGEIVRNIFYSIILALFFMAFPLYCYHTVKKAFVDEIKEQLALKKLA